MIEYKLYLNYEARTSSSATPIFRVYRIMAMALSVMFVDKKICLPGNPKFLCMVKVGGIYYAVTIAEGIMKHYDNVLWLSQILWLPLVILDA